MLLNSDARRVPLADGCVQTVVTSPPYWGLRKYSGDMVQVFGGVAGCQHEWGAFKTDPVHPVNRRCDKCGRFGVTERLVDDYVVTTCNNCNLETKSKSGTKGIKGITGKKPGVEHLDNLNFEEVKQGQFCRLCGAWRGELGLEPTPEMYVEHIVEIFREVRRVLRDDGTCWINLGDSYASQGGKGVNRYFDGRENEYGAGNRAMNTVASGLKPKDLCGIPWAVAFALRDDGWYLRSDIIWSKPNPMPESLNGWRWERHRVKVKDCQIKSGTLDKGAFYGQALNDIEALGLTAQWRDCPGCPTCEPHSGYVLRRGSWRPTKSHEYLFMLAKSDRYFADADAVREEQTGTAHSKGTKLHPPIEDAGIGHNDWHKYTPDVEVPGGRNRRTVWHIATAPYSGAHFACVDTETEILTRRGWRRWFELQSGQLVSGFNIQTGLLEWQPLDRVVSYEVQKQPMIKVGNRDLDMLLTPNHRCVVRSRTKKETITKDYQIVGANKLNSRRYIPVASEWDKQNFVVRHQYIHPAFAEICGWLLSDGHIIHDKYIGISQSLEVNKHKCGRIKSRLNILRADYKEHIATREYNGKPYRMMNLTIKGWVADKFLEIFPLKNIPGDIMDWSDRALGALLRGFIGGDGHKRDDGRTVIVQKDYDRISMLQAIAVKLGYTARLTRRKGGTWNLFLTNRTYRGLRGTNGKGTTITKELYSGIVWCPQTPLNTFVARRNGSVFITGNTFPPALVEPCIKAATSEHGCCPQK